MPYNMFIQGKRPMTTSFADYVAQQDARNTIQLNIRKWTMMLCDALEHNFTEYTVRAHKRSANLADRVEDKAYHEMKSRKHRKSVMLSLPSKKVVSISRLCSVTLVVVTLSMPLLTGRLVKFTKQHHSKFARLMNNQRCTLT